MKISINTEQIYHSLQSICIIITSFDIHNQSTNNIFYRTLLGSVPEEFQKQGVNFFGSIIIYLVL